MSAEDRLYDLLDECAERLRAGESLEACLAHYPEAAHALRPLLEAHLALEALQPPAGSPEAAQWRTRSAFMREVDARLGPARVRQPRTWSLRGAATALAVLCAFVFLGGVTVVASADSLPGDALYPLKRAVEGLELQFASLEQANALRDTYAQRRVEEARALVGERRAAEVAFIGVVEAASDEGWQVAGLAVQRDAHTLVETPPLAGDTVHVEGVTTAQGVVQARQITVLARPTPTPSPSPTASATPAASPTPSATHTPSGTPSPSPTATPSPRAIPSATPSHTPPAPQPTQAPAATAAAPPSQQNGEHGSEGQGDDHGGYGEDAGSDSNSDHGENSGSGDDDGGGDDSHGSGKEDGDRGSGDD